MRQLHRLFLFLEASSSSSSPPLSHVLLPGTCQHKSFACLHATLAFHAGSAPGPRLARTHTQPASIWLLQGVTHPVPLESVSACSPFPATAATAAAAPAAPATAATAIKVEAPEPAAEAEANPEAAGGGGPAAQPQRGKQGEKEVDEYCRFILQQAEHAAQGQGGTQLPPPQQQGPRRGLPALHASEAAAALARLDVGFHWASWGRELEQKGLQPIQVCMQAWCMWWLSQRASLTTTVVCRASTDAAPSGQCEPSTCTLPCLPVCGCRAI